MNNIQKMQKNLTKSKNGKRKRENFQFLESLELLESLGGKGKKKTTNNNTNNNINNNQNNVNVNVNVHVDENKKVKVTK